MEEWRFEPARDLGLTRNERRLSLRREVRLGERDYMSYLAGSDAQLSGAGASIENTWSRKYASASRHLF